MNKQILIPSSGREDQLSACIASLLKNNLTGWGLTVSLEPNCGLNIIKHLGGLGISTKFWKNGRNLGAWLNAFTLYETTFAEGADAVLFMDDDMIVSPDAIHLCNWYLNDYFKSTDDMGLCLCRRDQNDPSRPDSVSPNDTYMGLVGQGFCITKFQWYDFLRKKFWGHEPHFGGPGYDWAWGHYAVDEGKRFLRPRFSRSQHTGIHGVHLGEIFPAEISQQTGAAFKLEDK